MKIRFFALAQSVHESRAYERVFPAAPDFGRHAKYLVAMLLAIVILCMPRPVNAGTDYETQIAGFVYAVLQTLITGEFSGQTPTNAGASLKRPICRASDYADLRAARGNKLALDEFDKRCDLIEARRNKNQVNLTAYLPHGHCETLKGAFESLLAEQVYSAPRVPPTRFITFEYKGSYYSATRRDLARITSFQVSCQSDGSLRVDAKRRQP